MFCGTLILRSLRSQEGLRVGLAARLMSGDMPQYKASEMSG
jgi:hypothetical protein